MTRPPDVLAVVAAAILGAIVATISISSKQKDGVTAIGTYDNCQLYRIVDQSRIIYLATCKDGEVSIGVAP
jgi:hypothetical protein